MLVAGILFLLIASITAKNIAHIHLNTSSLALSHQCIDFYTIKSSDTCFDIASQYGITMDLMHAWNPSLSCKHLIPGKSMCVQGLSMGIPSFINPSQCVQQWHVQTNDTCADISLVTSVPTKTLEAINRDSPAGFDCHNLKVGSVVCLGPEQKSPRLLARHKVHSKSLHAHEKSAFFMHDDGALEETNRARKAVGVKPISWDASLAKAAYQYSQHLASQGCKLVHSGQHGQGENLYASYGSSSGSMANAVKLWVKEKWNWTRGQMNHFTQVVWSGTSKMGCAKGINTQKKCQVVTCRYWPQGNIIGRKPY